MNWKRIVFIYASVLFFNKTTQAKLYTPDVKVKLEQEFLDSLDSDQLKYLESKLTPLKKNKAIEVIDDSDSNLSDWEFFDVDQVEEEIQIASVRTSRPVTR